MLEQSPVDLCGSCGSDDDNDGDGNGDDNGRIIDAFCICALQYWPQLCHDVPFKFDFNSPVVNWITFWPSWLKSSLWAILKTFCFWNKTKKKFEQRSTPFVKRKHKNYKPIANLFLEWYATIFLSPKSSKYHGMGIYFWTVESNFIYEKHIES